MNPEETNVKRPDSNELAVHRTELAVERTIMASERTLMAWTRTAISMIGFGFTLYKFLQYMREEKMTPLLPLQGPRNLALAFIGLGILTLAMAALQSRQFIRRVRGPSGSHRFNLSLAVAGFVAVIGIFALMNVLFRIGPF